MPMLYPIYPCDFFFRGVDDIEMPVLSPEDLHAIPNDNQETEIETGRISVAPLSLPSILRSGSEAPRKRNAIKRKVSFPDNDSLLCTYREPEHNSFCWALGDYYL